jgi:hypothetical protein
MAGSQPPLPFSTQSRDRPPSDPLRTLGRLGALEHSRSFLFTNVGHPIELYSPPARSQQCGRIRGRKERWRARPSTVVCIW